MAKNVPSSFQDLKARVQQRLRNGEDNVQDDIIAMGDAMLEADVEPKSAQDRVAKRIWQASGPEEKKMLARMVAQMAKEEENLT